jgi:predicted nuclease of predicted toxin-antitoxin system
MRLLLDEHISPALVGRLARVGVYEIWEYALHHDFAVVTTNDGFADVLRDVPHTIPLTANA